ncbi:hypothetical protein KW797_02320 [Candidatus Parcubacteria bacterium]|nr:hypothetical protein [Candidatus Parcubacteria bacterium]
MSSDETPTTPLGPRTPIFVLIAACQAGHQQRIRCLGIPRESVELTAALMDGSAFPTKVPNSVIGKCGICKEPFTCSVEEEKTLAVVEVAQPSSQFEGGNKVTISGAAPQPGFENQGAPAPIDPATGQHLDYWVLSEEERAKGFLRPVRMTYKHCGLRPLHETRDLTAEEAERYKGFDYVKFEPYPEGQTLVGRYWTAKQLSSGCGDVTRMSRPLAETYARNPGFYGATFCATCKAHFPVGAQGEFVWEGTNERVGT